MKMGVESKKLAVFLLNTPILTFPLSGGRGIFSSPWKGEDEGGG
jgi:hypothetical protein